VGPGPQNLQRNTPVKLFVIGGIDCSQAAGPDLVFNAISGQSRECVFTEEVSGLLVGAQQRFNLPLQGLILRAFSFNETVPSWSGRKVQCAKKDRFSLLGIAHLEVGAHSN
jgi:hypothetical protein